MHPDQNIFFIPVGDLLQGSENDFFLVYAPLHDRMQIVSPQVVQDIHNGSQTGSEFLSLLLEDADKMEVPVESGEIRDIGMLYIILNYKCNFHCSYCYSAGGRSNEELSSENINGMIHFFLGKHTRNKTRRITFIGGGEPFLSWEKLKNAITEIRKKEQESECSVSIEIVTNGSLLTSDQALFLKQNDVRLQVSFEVLKDIQEKQRSSYQAVSSNVISASQDIPLSIRSVITALNVERLEEMVEEVHEKYPSVKMLRCDVEESRNRFSAKEQAQEFYKKYNDHFLKARKLATQYGISLDNYVTRSMNRITSRFCNMMLCLVPNGSVTSCVCYSSEKEEGFSEFVYGKMENGTFILNSEKFRELIGQDVWKRPECWDCFMKWHCGGGCIAHRILHDDDLQQIVCESSRDLFRRILIRNLEEYVQEEYNSSLAAFLKTGENT